MSRRATTVVLVVALVVALVLTLLSASSFVLARGSDAAVRIYTLPFSTKVLTLVVVAAAWTASAVVQRIGQIARWTLRIVGLGSLILATHVISFNVKRGVLEEHWLLARLDRASFNVAEGLGHDWRVEPVALGYALSHRTRGATVFVFSGLPPWKLDLGPSLASGPPR